MALYKVMLSGGGYTQGQILDIVDPELYATITRSVPLEPADPLVNDISSALYGATGIASFPAAAAAANNVSLAEVLRYISETQLSKLDEAATLGLLGTSNSLAYRVHEIERHLHGYQRWYGMVAGGGTAANRATPVGQAVAPFVVDGGNKVYGDWVNILGTSDTTLKYDMHSLMVIATETPSIAHFIQLAYGVTGDAAIGAGTYSEIVYRSVTAASRQAPMNFMSRRQPAGTPAWARVLAYETDTSTLSFYFGLHSYEG